MSRARANSAWLAVRKSDYAETAQFAREALAIWQASSFSFPFQWTALLPLLEASLQTDDVPAAVLTG